MKEKKFVKIFRTTKIIQLCLLFILEISFFIILVTHPALGKNLYNNPTLFILSSITWILMIFSLICLFIDFYQMRRFAVESHALNRAAYLDNLTGIPNRHGLDVVFQTYDTPESMASVGCFMVTIDNLKTINESLGHQTGDLLIQNFCSIFEETGDSFGVVGRNGGNEFILVINNCTDVRMNQFIKNLETQITEYNAEHTVAPLQLNYTYILNSEEHAQAFTHLLTATYNKLHA